jgi:predicted regulator of Ras-like GTPase activity (Roadblock/LC7/MglB family)
MEELLRDINAVVGVGGSFVCDQNGEVLAAVLPSTMHRAGLWPIGRTVTQTVAGLQTVRKRKVGDIDLLYANGRFIIKSLRGGCLCIFCAPRINVPLLNMTADVAVRKIAARLQEKAQGRPQSAGQPPQEARQGPEARQENKTAPRKEGRLNGSGFLGFRSGDS